MLVRKASVPCGSGKKIAVLISGKTEPRHIQNIELAFRVLSRNGYPENNIYILDGEGYDRPRYPIYSAAWRRMIFDLFELLKEKITPQDTFFLYTTGHGQREYKQVAESSLFLVFMLLSTLDLPNSNGIDEVELHLLANSLRPGLGIYVFDQCFSGGFARRFAGKDRVAISACREYEESDNNSFPQLFFSAFPNVSTANSRSRTSVQEAFQIAVEAHRGAIKKIQTPMIFCEPGRNVYL